MNGKLREITEALEMKQLSRYAQKSSHSRGRIKAESECHIRTPYQRDRDRIIHSKSFRALKEKTQVFIVKDDFFRTRLSHTLELSQIARTVARALALNEDLVEAIALGHDLGHTCFGHSGEEELNRITGHFKHNEQSLRVVDILEREGKGLNLTMEVRDGILNHTGSTLPYTLEGRLVKITDRITYLCHDIQDCLSAGILKESEIPPICLKVLGGSHSQRINTFVLDLIEETSKQLKGGNEPGIYQSRQLQEITDELRSFMFSKVYYGELCEKEKEKAVFIVSSLYDYYSRHPEEIPREYAYLKGQESKNQTVTDFIASLTDTYAIRLFQEKFIPWPNGSFCGS